MRDDLDLPSIASCAAFVKVAASVAARKEKPNVAPVRSVRVEKVSEDIVRVTPVVNDELSGHSVGVASSRPITRYVELSVLW
jgi:hypothetical protein